MYAQQQQLQQTDEGDNDEVEEEEDQMEARFAKSNHHEQAFMGHVQNSFSTQQEDEATMIEVSQRQQQRPRRRAAPFGVVIV